jgi:hypothetical protein
MLKTVTRLI